MLLSLLSRLLFIAAFAIRPIGAVGAQREYRLYPRRTAEEAAVIEWGHSAIISALDASVAHFGPQTSQAALLEVETMPVLAVPVNGVQKNVQGDDENIRPLQNADEVHGNMVVMTNTGGLSGVEMALIAQASGAAALMVVNVDNDRPDDIYRLPASDERASQIQIPVVMISLNSANVLTSATVTPDMRKEDVINNGMPDRVRLYAGGDRPFFEDVESAQPTIYLIHNLLSEEECDSLVEKARNKVQPLEKSDSLQMSRDHDKYPKVKRVMLWQGMLQTPATKQIEERIEQVTGFPVAHYSDFIVDELGVGASWLPHYDAAAMIDNLPIATITIYLTDSPQGALVYLNTEDAPVKILPKKGMAIVHHNTDEHQEHEQNSRHAMEPITEGTIYVARKFVLAMPPANARRFVLPAVALPFGGKLPNIMVTIYELFVDKFGPESGGTFFNKFCVFVPVLVVLLLAQKISEFVQQKDQHPKKTVASSSSTTARREKKTK